MRIIIDIWRQGPLDSREKEHWTRAPTPLPATSSLDPGSIRDAASTARDTKDCFYLYESTCIACFETSFGPRIPKLGFH